MPPKGPNQQVIHGESELKPNEISIGIIIKIRKIKDGDSGAIGEVLFKVTKISGSCVYAEPVGKIIQGKLCDKPQLITALKRDLDKYFFLKDCKFYSTESKVSCLFCT